MGEMKNEEKEELEEATVGEEKLGGPWRRREIQEERETMTGLLGQVTQLIGTEKLDTCRMWGQGENQLAAIAETLCHHTE